MQKNSNVTLDMILPNCVLLPKVVILKPWNWLLLARHNHFAFKYFSVYYTLSKYTQKNLCRARGNQGQSVEKDLVSTRAFTSKFLKYVLEYIIYYKYVVSMKFIHNFSFLKLCEVETLIICNVNTFVLLMSYFKLLSLKL